MCCYTTSASNFSCNLSMATPGRNVLIVYRGLQGVKLAIAQGLVTKPVAERASSSSCKLSCTKGLHSGVHTSKEGGVVVNVPSNVFLLRSLSAATPL